MDSIERFEDDHKFDRLIIVVGDDGDVWIKTVHEQPMTSLRFRLPMLGGGESPHTFKALRKLVTAIELDNTESPQVRKGDTND